MDTRETPELNFHTAVDLTHSKTNTEASLDFVYGKSIKTDDNKIASSVIVNHQINSRAASVDYNLRAYYQPLVGQSSELFSNSFVLLNWLAYCYLYLFQMKQFKSTVQILSTSLFS